MFKKWIVVIMSFLLVLSGCQASVKDSQTDSTQLSYRYASKTEGQELLLSNTEYYDRFSQNDLDYKMQKKNATMEEYQAFSKEQVQGFSKEEKKYLDSCFKKIEKIVSKNGYVLPDLDEIVLIKTTMKEECGAAAYTHGTQIYIQGAVIDLCMLGDDDYMVTLLSHELFHCLTRCNPDFRKDMYKIIHFTVVENDYPIPASVFEYHITNPDVEHHNSYATFRINGEDIDCFTDFVTTKHFEKKGDQFFDVGTTALIPIDGSNVYYTPKDAENFDEIFGKNTDYVIDPEECMADNFSFVISFGTKGQNGDGYKNPEIIESIIEYLKNNEK